MAADIAYLIISQMTSSGTSALDLAGKPMKALVAYL